MKLFLYLLSVAFAALVAVAPVGAQTPSKPSSEPAMSADARAVQKLVLSKFPGSEVRHVAKSPYFGLYEVLLDDRLIYTDAKVSYLVVGSIYDTNSKTNLTEERQRKLNRIAWDELPLQLAIKKVKGDGSRRLAVFSDADCPFCARLEKEIEPLTNVTIYTFLFPIDQLHPQAAQKSRQIWCSPDPVKAWDEFFRTGTAPDNAGDCPNPVAETQQLGNRLRVTATPTLIFADGSVVPGALPLKRIEDQLQASEVEAKKIAAAKK
jgi:thiol:disulfide interchange protein DsbC